MSLDYTVRPNISLHHGKICHDGDPCRVVLKKDKISVGCTDITPEALRWVLSAYEKAFSESPVVVLQE